MVVLHEYTNGVVVEDTASGKRCRCYLADNTALASTLEEIRSRLDNLPPDLLADGVPTMAGDWLEEEDWAHAWKAYFKPLRIGQRLVIKPTWQPWPPEDNPAAARDDDVILELDPGMAFGTGAHPTTRLCLAALEEHLRPGMRVLDLGCGSGILTIAAGKLGAGAIVSIDVDPLATEATLANCERNGVTAEVRQAAGLSAVTETFDVVVANISAAIIKQETPLVPARLASGGLFISSGYFEGWDDEITALLEANGFMLLAERTEELWGCLHARKR